MAADALAGLAGFTPDASLPRDLATIAMITAALQKGITWAQIARALGEPNGQAAKARAKRIARRANRRLFLRDGPGGAG